VNLKQSLRVKNTLLQCGVMALCRYVKSPDTVAILRYHAIVDPENNYYASPSIGISPKIFEAQLRYFAEKNNIVSLDKVAQCLADGQPFPPRAVVLTFDDGYRDNYLAYRIMKKYGATGTFYIAAGCIDAGEPLWLFEVIYLLKKTKAINITIAVDDFDETFPLENATARLVAARKITAIIKSNDLKFREKVRDQIRDQTRDVEDYLEKAAQVMLTWEQVRELSANGMNIGGHTVTHLNLPNADPNDAASEINNCKILIEEKIGKQVDHFSYPNGGDYDYYNNVIKEYVKQAGYKTATTSNNGLAAFQSDVFELNRIRITDHLAEIVYQIECEALVDKTLRR
jgi:peptidoglycan/xylan/chitin deacetylase (PgdA/CDA1 family)